jgi:O-antigen biosynthesis protein
MKIFEKDGPIPLNTSPHSPHSLIYNQISKNSEILDIGCNTGLLGRQLRSKNVIADGIDINSKLLKIAQRYYRHTYIRDLYQPHLSIPHHQYDYVVLSDILEHLPSPDKVLLDIHQYLKPNGIVLVSLPNVARLEIRLKLLLGSFDYQFGILSPDHLRFFTLKTGIKLFQSTGYSVIKTIPTGFGHRFPFFPNLLAFQFIYILKSRHKNIST